VFETLGPALLGGAVIGVTLAVLALLTGRVVSGSRMIGSLLGGPEGPAASSMAFIAGLFIAPIVLIAFGYLKQVPAEAGLPLIAVGGVLVGIGARLGGSSLFGGIGGLARGSRQVLPGMFAMLLGVALASVLVFALGAGGFT